MDESIPLEILEIYGCMDVIEESLQDGNATTASTRASQTLSLIRNISESKRYNDRPLLKNELKNLEHETRTLQVRAYRARQRGDPEEIDELRDRISHQLYELEHIGELFDASIISFLEMQWTHYERGISRNSNITQTEYAGRIARIKSAYNKAVKSQESRLFRHRGAEIEESPRDYIGYA